MRTERAQLLLSLDVELGWGLLHDQRALKACEAQLRRTQEQVFVRLLRLLEAYEIHATWALVGMLGCADADDCLIFAPTPALRPVYLNASLDPYPALMMGGIARQYPTLFFAPWLPKRLATAPGQELATHTFAHIYVMEAGVSLEAFDADLEAAIRVAAHWGQPLRSIVFPGNQLTPGALACCTARGLRCYRGLPHGWLMRPRPKRAHHPLLRATRFLESVVPLRWMRESARLRSAGSDLWPSTSLTNLPADRFVRFAHPSCRGAQNRAPRQLPADRFVRFARPLFFRLHWHKINEELEHAVQMGARYHLWWHPHNMAAHIKESFDALERFLEKCATLREQGRLESLTMSECAARLEDSPQCGVYGHRGRV